ncbi:MAG: TonB-dependent receptor [Lewinellaceae bacterium]|nr:TonB-dependent receptor [Lewinellaceae bacterium]
MHAAAGQCRRVEYFAQQLVRYLIAGLDVKGDYVLGAPDSFLYGEHRALGAGVYVQDEVTLSNRLTATAGIRYDHYRIFGQVQESNVSPKVALLYFRPGPIFQFGCCLRRHSGIRHLSGFIKFEPGGRGRVFAQSRPASGATDPFYGARRQNDALPGRHL